MTFDVKDNATGRLGTLDGMYWFSGVAEVIWEGDTNPSAVKIGSFSSLTKAPEGEEPTEQALGQIGAALECKDFAKAKEILEEFVEAEIEAARDNDRIESSHLEVGDE